MIEKSREREHILNVYDVRVCFCCANNVCGTIFEDCEEDLLCMLLFILCQ